MASRITIPLPSPESVLALGGNREANLKILSQVTGASLVLRGQDLDIWGTDDQVKQCQEVVQVLAPLWCQGQRIAPVDVRTAYQSLQTDLRSPDRDVLARTRRGEVVRAKTPGQHSYVQAVRSHDLTICTGPAGTGKTFLATVVAVQALLDHQYDRLVLTRPAVEAGEKLGFLPGDIQQKIDPYLRPLYDALAEFIDPEKMPSLMERGILEVAPLAYMRGRTLNNAFVIVDEAQNTTPAQMKMVLTRLGDHAKMVVTGDLTQTDLSPQQPSGLAVATHVLREVEGIAFCHLGSVDVTRHPLVQKIVTAYDQYSA